MLRLARWFSFVASSLVGLLLFAEQSQGQRAPALELEQVLEGLTEYRTSLQTLSDWSYTATIRQSVEKGTSSDTMVSSVYFSRRESASAAVVCYWRDGVERSPPNLDQWRGDDTALGRNMYHHVFADEASYVNYNLYDTTPNDSTDAGSVYRNVGVFVDESDAIAEHNLELVMIPSRPLLFYESGTSHNIIDLLLEAPAGAVSAGQTLEIVAGRSCVLLVAKTSSGLIRLWVDPASGYLPRKAERARGPGDQFMSRQLWQVMADPDAERKETYGWHDFTVVNRVQIPSRFSAEVVTRSAQGREVIRVSGTAESASGSLQAIPEPVRSYLWTTDTIPDGTDASIFNSPGQNAVPIQHIWDGEAVRRIVNQQAEADISAVVAGVKPNEPGTRWTFIALFGFALTAVCVVGYLLWRGKAIHAGTAP